MYTNMENEQIRKKAQEVLDKKNKSNNIDEIKELDSMYKQLSSILISNYYGTVNYSRFDFNLLATTLSDITSAFEGKDKRVDEVILLEPVGRSSYFISYSALVIKDVDDDMKLYEQKDIDNSDLIILYKTLGVIPDKIDCYSIDTTADKINKDTLNLEHIKGVKEQFCFKKHEYLNEFIENVVDYKRKNGIVDLNKEKMNEFASNFVLEYLDKKENNNGKMKYKK